MDSIQLLDTDLLEKKKILQEILYWKNLFRSQIGWHYILDPIWQMDSIESLELPRGAKILDAEAGIGLMQYLLAARGFEVYSFDFTTRRITWPKSCIFHMQYLKNEQHYVDYLNHLSRHRKSGKLHRTLYELKKIILNYHIKLIKKILPNIITAQPLVVCRMAYGSQNTCLQELPNGNNNPKKANHG